MKKLHYRSFEDKTLDNTILKDTLDTEFSAEYLDINPTDVIKDHVNFSELTRIGRRNLARKYSKKK